MATQDERGDAHWRQEFDRRWDGKCPQLLLQCDIDPSYYLSLDDQELLKLLHELQREFGRRVTAPGMFHETVRALRRIIVEKAPIFGREASQKESARRHQLRRQALAMLAADIGRLASSDPPGFAELPKL